MTPAAWLRHPESPTSTPRGGEFVQVVTQGVESELALRPDEAAKSELTSVLSHFHLSEHGSMIAFRRA